jgi:hypothetical protein
MPEEVLRSLSYNVPIFAKISGIRRDPRITVEGCATLEGYHGISPITGMPVIQ